MDCQSNKELYWSSPTVRRILYGSSSISGKPQQATHLLVVRPIHGSQALSDPVKVVSNRPLSPNLIVKKPQLSATYSISHRIFGVVLWNDDEEEKEALQQLKDDWDEDDFNDDFSLQLRKELEIDAVKN